ncbi:RING-H2 finger protein ATL16-like [Cornus florida]|uniref:RING-H2 finger protein ATL16-like n=1 Tax=Cornus florida TaxID=4283 RepID=UPI0028A0C38F|nr:RING-H2 finger protein ATL16-like [Cornus florida]
MDLVIKNYNIHGSQPLSPNKTPPSSIFGTPLHSSPTSFPIIAIAIIGILATAFLLVSYYIFVIKCCLNWHRIDLLRRFSFSRNRHREDPLIIHSPAMENRGLDESVIRSIPIFQFKKKEEKEQSQTSRCECAVCLNEFQEEENLRVIPNCGHVFHIDCIDVWLQSNANCPLCRRSISAATTSSFAVEQHNTAPSSSSTQDQENNLENDEEFVVIELGELSNYNESSLGEQERSNSGELWAPSSRRFDKVKRLNHVPSIGDECIDIRHKDDEFSIQPTRRSFSMDSAADPQLFLAIQELVQQKRHVSEVSSVRRSLFSFGHGRGSRSTILPIHLDP